MTITQFCQNIKDSFNQSTDILFRELQSGNTKMVFSYVDGCSDKELLELNIIRPLLSTSASPTNSNISDIVNYGEDVKTVAIEKSADTVAEGDVVLYIENENQALIFSLRKFEKRSVAEPPTASVLTGPREGFIEAIKTNISLIRRRLKTTSLTVNMLKIGRYSTTSVAMIYINGIADDIVVQTLQAKLSAIDLDGIIDSSYITAYIKNRRHSIFTQVGNTEKPDVAAAKLLEGRVAIVVDGSPIVLTVPFLLFESMQDGYDYYSLDWHATMVRFFRLTGALFTVLLPGAYVALQSFHFHLLPIKFLIALISATTGIPFPPSIEMLIVLLLFEILNQASIRMPRFMGISLSVVGALVLGETAVSAGLISSPAVLIMALSAIGIFCVPDQVGTLSILRILFLCVASVLGFFGMIILSLLVFAYLVVLENFGAPYLAPYAPRINPDLKDALIMTDLTEMKRRPFSFPNQNRFRRNEYPQFPSVDDK